MFNPSYLTLSDYNVYHLRWPVPVSYTQGKRLYVKFSLETRDPTEALLLAKAMSYHAATLIEQGWAKGMDYIELRDVLQGHFKAMREQRKQGIMTNGRLSPLDIAALEKRQASALAANASGDFSQIGTDAEIEAFIATHELPIKRDEELYGTLRKEFLLAMGAYCRSVLEYDSRFNDYDFKTDPASLAMRETVKRNERKKLAASIETYISEKLRLKEWREHIADDYRSQFKILTRYLGEEASLHVSPELAAEVKAMLVKLPKHANKKAAYKALSIGELMALNLPAKDCISAVTVSKMLRAYSTFFDWAVKRKETDANNFASLVDNTKKVALERSAFGDADVKRILEYVKSHAKPHHKWGTLVALYTGARLNEVAQLHTKDIVEKDGVLCFSFSDEAAEEGDDLKRVKNDASKRVVPIHSKLKELGFLEYKASVGEGRLFPAFTYHKKDGYGRNLGRWFNESLLRKQLAITDPKLVFHSIRHTVALQLRNRQVAEATIKDIVGHSQDGVTLKVYASKLNKKVMLEALDKLSYD